jgi:hypothetical protein
VGVMPYREAYLTRDTLGVGHAAGASGPVSPPPLPTRLYTFCSTFSTPREGPAGTRRDMATGESSKRPRFLWTARQALVQRYCSSAGRGPQGGGRAGPPLNTASHDAALQRQPSSRCGTLKATQLCNKEADATCVPAAALAGACGGSRLPPAAALRPAPALAPALTSHQPLTLLHRRTTWLPAGWRRRISGWWKAWEGWAMPKPRGCMQRWPSPSRQLPTSTSVPTFPTTGCGLSGWPPAAPAAKHAPPPPKPQVTQLTPPPPPACSHRQPPSGLEGKECTSCSCSCASLGAPGPQCRKAGGQHRWQVAIVAPLAGRADAFVCRLLSAGWRRRMKRLWRRRVG